FEQTPPPKGDQARAHLTIELPGDAKLYIDGQLMKSTAGRRTFQTPELDRGGIYFYDLRAEIVRDGRLISSTRRVILRPGDSINVSFADLNQATSEAPSQPTEQ
ncbi:MAG: TIGR03000 domain-containing protein, partial [Gemmataceae bacterium]|nr:TIGR03000 domain-containing protein [Gemmataceae bacterium]